MENEETKTELIARAGVLGESIKISRVPVGLGYTHAIEIWEFAIGPWLDFKLLRRQFGASSNTEPVPADVLAKLRSTVAAWATVSHPLDVETNALRDGVAKCVKAVRELVVHAKAMEIPDDAIAEHMAPLLGLKIDDITDDWNANALRAARAEAATGR